VSCCCPSLPNLRLLTPSAVVLSTRPSPDDDSTNLPTIESIAREREARKARQRSALASIAADDPLDPGHESRLDMAPSGGVASGEAGVEGGALGSPEELEEEASQEGAFNPETGEINWDCPCLGGMAHGPCGEEFKAAFSCFVYSSEEPKGMDCIDKFKCVYCRF
jgi:mitochondrial intermembrane space import and assembly protein 40